MGHIKGLRTQNPFVDIYNQPTDIASNGIVDKHVKWAYKCFEHHGLQVISPTFGDLTPCFVQGVMFGFLAVFAIVCGVYQWSVLYKKKVVRTSNASPFFYIKLMLGLVQIALFGALYNVSGNGIHLLNAIGGIIILGVHYVENFKSVVPNTILLSYWLSSTILFPFRVLNFGVRGNLSDLEAICSILACFNSLFMLIIELYAPLIRPDQDTARNPYDSANFISKLSFSWMGGLVSLGYRKYLIEADLPVLSTFLKTSTNIKLFAANWENQKSQKPSIVLSLFKSFGGYYSLCTVYKVAQNCSQFLQPQLLKMLISFVNEYAEARKVGKYLPLTKGFIISIAMFGVSVLQTIFTNQYFLVMFDTSINVKSSLTATVYNKAMVLSNSAKSQSNTGDIVNLMSVDVQRMQDSVQTLQNAWSCPFQVILCLVSLYDIVGNAMWSGVVLMLIMIPINSQVARFQKGLQKTQMKYKDERSRLMSEIMNNIKSLKLYGWESPYLDKLNHIRNDKELKNLQKMGICVGFTIMLWNFSPVLVSCSTFATFTYFGNGRALSSEIIFPCLALFNLLAMPLQQIPQVIASLIEIEVALERLRKFLYSEELQHDAVQRLPKAANVGDVAIEVKDATFNWSSDKDHPSAALTDINLVARKGHLDCIVGRVGSGKSSFMQALLGDLYKVKGTVSVHGSVAYVAQVPWIMNGSIKDNILFGHTYEPEFYQKVIKACALTVDLTILPKGDQTLVGEKGISLSGGQKARLSLARAVYARADVYLIDDALSAVDEHVGKHLIDHVLGPRGLLHSKCKVLATNNIGVLSIANNLHMVSEGKIVEQGSFEAIQQQPESKLYKLIKEFGKKESSTEETPAIASEDSDDDFDVKSLKSAHKVLLDDRLEMEMERQEEDEEVFNRREVSEQGHVKYDVYIKYMKACNQTNFIFWIVVILLSMMVNISSSVWLKHWSDVNSKLGYNSDIGFYLGIYILLGIGGAVCLMIQNCVSWLFCAIDASKSLHNEMAVRVLRAPMSFFETTPIGRILNRFSNDIYRIDENLIRVIGIFFTHLFKASLSLVVICVSTWQVVLMLVPLTLLYLYHRKYYSRSSRELRRLESISRSPIFANFQESLNGINTIRAYGQVDRFRFLNELKVDKNTRAYHPSMNCNRWLSVRLEFVGSMVIFGASAFSIFALRQGSVSPGLVGLSLSYALQITQILNALVRMSVEVETNIVSVERIMEYSKLEIEAPEIIEDNRPAETWPTKGNVTFKNYSTRYRPELDLVLKNIDLSIEAKEKIGIVGRTGAGKSSLTLALFRIIEAVSGNINIDSLNTSTIGLKDLRQHLSIIPQDSQVFQGTIRSNLDPFDTKTDDELWKALELSHLKPHIMLMYEQQVSDSKGSEDIPNGLFVKLSEGGSNLSVGQRQLMCLARALLVPSHILVLDEATAAVDVETDQLLQTTIRSEFKDRTILTIAHRINTILDSDKILVLEKGEVAEFDTPETLLKNKESLFYSLCKQGGFVTD